MTNNYKNYKKILRVFFKNSGTSFNHGNLKYLFDVAIQIEKKEPREKYKKHFEELRLRNIYSELEPLTIFFTFIKTMLKVEDFDISETMLTKHITEVCNLIKTDNIKLSDFKNMSSREMIEFTNDIHNIFGLKFNGYKYHVKKFSEYELIHDSKKI